MSDLLTNRFISHSQSLKANVLSKSRSRLSRAKDEPFYDVRTCQPDATFQTTWTQIKNRVVQLANSELQRWRSNGSVIRETQAAARPMLRDYWGVVGVSPSDSQLGDSDWQDDHPWSAVFISYVMRQAGAGNFFTYASLHMRYVHAAKQNTVNRVVDNPFWLCDVDNALPEPGDLICMNRAGSTFTYDTVRPSGSSHSDIVVSVNRQAGTITVIGGNKSDSVNSQILHLNSDGTVDTSRHTDVFAVLKLRTEKCFTCGTTAVV
jgi:hypothetical protein